MDLQPMIISFCERVTFAGKTLNPQTTQIPQIEA
jgi:hypothetical protein